MANRTEYSVLGRLRRWLCIGLGGCLGVLVTFGVAYIVSVLVIKVLDLREQGVLLVLPILLLTLPFGFVGGAYVARHTLETSDDPNDQRQQRRASTDRRPNS